MPTPPKIVQFRRGTTEEHADLIGAEGELTVDLDKKTLVVHDGIRPGGYPLRRADATAIRQNFIEFKTAIVQNNIAFLGLSTDDNPPTPIGIHTQSGMDMAVARFTPTDQQNVYGRFTLPSNWPETSMIFKISWRTEDVTQAVTWKLEVGGLSDGDLIETFDFNPHLAVTTTPPTTPNQLITSTIVIDEEHLDGIIPLGDCYFRLSRGFDSSMFPADVISFRFYLDRLSV